MKKLLNNSGIPRVPSEDYVSDEEFLNKPRK
jgi:hypothetical protein